MTEVSVPLKLIWVFAIGFCLTQVYLLYLLRLFIKIKNSAKERGAEALRLLRELTENGPNITLWLKNHKEELEKHPITTLNNPEFIDLINRGQALYERILEIYPDYSDAVMPPKELRQYLIEIVKGQHRQTH